MKKKKNQSVKLVSDVLTDKLKNSLLVYVVGYIGVAILIKFHKIDALTCQHYASKFNRISVLV